MGCGKTTLSTAPEIDLSLEPTYVARFDEVISTLQRPLDVLVAALKVIRNEQRGMLRTFGVWESIRNAEIRDVMLAVALMLAGECKGDFHTIGFEMIPKSPYIKLEGTVSKESEDRFRLFQGFIGRLEAIPGQMRTIQPELSTALTRANGIPHSAISSAHKTELNNSNLGALEANRVRDKIKSNIEKIRAAGILATETSERASAVLKQVKESSIMLRTHSELWGKVLPGDLRTIVREFWPQKDRVI